jgi:hypothetical protein
LHAEPGGLALSLGVSVDDPSLQLYPSGIHAGTVDIWALRLDGLQIGTASATTATLTVGKPGKGGDGWQRKLLSEVFGTPAVTVSTAEHLPPGHLSVPEAADAIRRLLCRFREVDVRGGPISHPVGGSCRQPPRRAGGISAVPLSPAEDTRALRYLLRLKASLNLPPWSRMAISIRSRPAHHGA